MSKNSEHVQRSRRKTAEYVRALKDNIPCMDCQISYPYYVMEFDHVRGKKSFNLSLVTRTNISMGRILSELEKCEIVCSNCHAIRTHIRKVG